MMVTHMLALVDDDVFLPGEAPFPMALHIAKDERPVVIIRRSDLDRDPAAVESRMWQLLAEQAYFDRRPAVVVYRHADGSIGGVFNLARGVRFHERAPQA